MQFLQQITNPWVKVQNFQNTEHLCWGYGTGQRLHTPRTPGNKHFKTNPNPFMTLNVTHLEASLRVCDICSSFKSQNMELWTQR